MPRTLVKEVRIRRGGEGLVIIEDGVINNWDEIFFEFTSKKYEKKDINLGVFYYYYISSKNLSI